MALPTGKHKMSHLQQGLSYVHRCIQILLVRPLVESEPGVTWIELLVAFELNGGILEATIREREAGKRALPRMTIRQTMILFKSLVRFVADTCLTAADPSYFKAANCNGIRLRQLAIQHSIPSLSFMPVWPDELARMITRGLLRQKGRMTKESIQALQCGSLQLQWTNLQAMGPLSVLRDDAPSHDAYHEDMACNEDPALLHFLACPKCDTRRDVSTINHLTHYQPRKTPAQQ